MSTTRAFMRYVKLQDEYKRNKAKLKALNNLPSMYVATAPSLTEIRRRIQLTTTGRSTVPKSTLARRLIAARKKRYTKKKTTKPKTETLAQAIKPVTAGLENLFGKMKV